MALVKGTNSYVTVAEADAYFADYLDTEAWDAADVLKKTKALVSATRCLDVLAWSGTAVSESQPLAFPRDIEYFEVRVGVLVSLKGTPERVADATMQQALHLLSNEGILLETGGVVSLDISGVGLNTIKAASRIPNVVRNLIQPLLTNKGSNSWWRSN
jgi:hypothetical protein